MLRNEGEETLSPGRCEEEIFLAGNGIKGESSLLNDRGNETPFC